MTSNKGTSPKIFYGWWIVSAAIICQFVSMSVGQGTVGIFLEPVTTELGWAVWQYTLGPSLAVGIGAFAGIIAGQIVDQRGPRLLILVGAAVCGLCLLGLAWQSQIWLYWGFHILAGVAGWNLFGPLIINATLNKWFINKRGWALAIGSIGISLGGLITPIAMTTIVDSVGWRLGYTILAIFVLIVIIPISLIMRRMPEDVGLLPDGDTMADIGDEAENDSKKENGEKNSESQDVRSSVGLSLTRAQAVQTSSFWLLVLGFGLNVAALTSVLVHAIPFATAAGFTRTIAAVALTVNGLGNLASKAVWGYCLQHIQPQRLVVSAYSISAFGVGLMLLAAWQGAAWLLFPGFFCYGFGFGGTIPLSEFMWAKYFGRTHIGAIRGVGQLITIIGPTVVPVVVGLWFDMAGTYQPAFLMLIGLYLTGAIFVGVSREPELDMAQSHNSPRRITA
ncbi:MAG: MFS transporter [Chloroflexota bacterium]